MSKLLRVFFTGMFISFLGSLPLGTLNVAVMQIAMTDGIRPAVLFSLGSLTSEIGYVTLSLLAMEWVTRQKKIFKVLEWVTLLIIIALAISSFYAASQPNVEKNIILSSTLHRFWLGLVMCALNPVQIPFWFGWGTVLFTKKLLEHKSSHYYTYVSGISLGTIMAACIFIFGGRFIGEKLDNNQHILNWVIGGIFAITAVIQLWKMMTRKGVEHSIEHPEEITQRFEEHVQDIGEERKKSP